MARARATNFQIFGVPLLTIVAGATIVPTLLNMFREVPLDFAVFMMSARWLRQGVDPYQELLARHLGNANPPTVLLALIPLSFATDSLAFIIWAIASTAALLFSLKRISSALKLPFVPLLIIALGLQGISATLRFGQITLLLLPLMTLAFIADREGRSKEAGAWLGALIYAKPFVGVFAVYMLWRREWRALRSMIVVYIAFASVGLFAGIRLTLSWIHTLRSITNRTSHVVNASWAALMARMFSIDVSQPMPAYQPFFVAPALASALALAGALTIAAISSWAIARTTSRDVHWAILATAMLLMSPLGWMYYLPLLIPALAAVVPSSRHLTLILVAAAILWAPSSLLARNSYGPLATATYASPYVWGLLLLWIALVLDQRSKQSPHLSLPALPAPQP